MARYEIYLTNEKGARIALLQDFVSLTCTQIANDVGTIILQMPAGFDVDLLKRDRMIQVWRGATDTGLLTLWRVYFIRKWRFEMQGSSEKIYIYGQDSNVMLNWRIVASYAGETESKKTDYADDIMKEIVTENLGGSAAAARDWSAYLKVQADLGSGPSITKAFAWRNVLEVLRDIADASSEAGTLLWFDVVPYSVSSSAIVFEFKTYTGQPGIDRTSVTALSDRVVFSQESGNLENPYYELDGEEELTYVYAGGQGELSARETQETEDTARSGLSVWGRKEGFADARNQAAAAGVLQSAYSLLRNGRPITRFVGRPLDTKGTRFGKDWNYGDKVVAVYRNVEYNCIISLIQITLTGGYEIINARLEYEE